MMHPVDYAPSQDFGDNPTKHLPASHWIIQQFGNYQPDGHTGIDYPCPVGTEVRAAADGVVRHVGRLGGSYADNPWWIAPSFAGFTYVVDHGHFIGIYGHCMDGAARVSAGQRVAEGQVLGLSGNTGASTGPHLHFECLPDGYILNSYMYGRINPHTLFTTSSLSYAGTTTAVKEEEDMGHVDSISEQAKKEIAEMVYGWVVKDDTGHTANISWYLLSRKAATEELIRQIAQATAQAVLNAHLPNVATGGTTTLGLETSWAAANVRAVLQNAPAAPEGISAEEVARLVEQGIKQVTDNFSITLTAQKAGE